MYKGLDTQGILDGQLYMSDAIAFSALEGNTGSQGGLAVCVLICPQRFRIRFVAHAQAALCKHAYFGNPCLTVLVLYIPFLPGTIFHQDQ